MKDTNIDSPSQNGSGNGAPSDDMLTHVGLLPPGHVPSHLAQRETDEKTSAVVSYLLPKVDEFRQLSELRRKGWESSAGDEAFKAQRKRADNLAEDVSQYNFKLMGRIAEELHKVTGAFQMPAPSRESSVLDLCAAPGGFLNTAMRINPGCRAVGFSLHPDEGGYSNLLSPFRKRCMQWLDTTMLTADMGVTEIPADHPDAAKFLPRQIDEDDQFDLVLCDGHVLRTQDRSSGPGGSLYQNDNSYSNGATDKVNGNDNHSNHTKHYRELYENYRLKYVQLALGLEHLKPGGTMVVLLHKVEMWNTLCVVRHLARFSRKVQLHKPHVSHTTRSSFYMVATGVDSTHPDAIAAVANGVTGGGEAGVKEQEENEESKSSFEEKVAEALREGEPSVEDMIEEFGPELVRQARDVWKVQADALERAPYIRGH
ncbi:hypothetical protein PG995_006752 [Apiospora arundinis]